MIPPRIKMFLSDYSVRREYRQFLKANGLEGSENISTHMTQPEKRKLFELASRVEFSIAEVGSYVGASSCFLAAGAAISNQNVYCVDTWQNNAMTEGSRDTFAEFTKNTMTFANRIRALRGTSVEMSRTFNDKLGLLFIDGDHSYEGVQADWRAWSQYLAPNATVVFHDIEWAEGVQKLVQEEVSPYAFEVNGLPNLYWAKVNLG